MKRQVWLGCLATTAFYVFGCSSEPEQFVDDTESSSTGDSEVVDDGASTGVVTSVSETATTDAVSTTGPSTSGGETDDGSSTTGSEDVELRIAELVVDGVEPLTNGFHFELWGIVNGSAVTIGKFNVDESGAVVDLDGIAVPDAQFDAGRDLRVASDFVITIEAAGDRDITPGASRYIAGPRMGEQSELGLVHERAIGSEFADADGAFILATPTDGPDTEEYAGVWWLDLSTEPPTPGLVLPELPSGWQYEGWAVVDGLPISTGRFVSPDEPDLAAEFSGELPGPTVPGEDLLNGEIEGVVFPVDLRGQTVVISVEPQPDDSPAPFSLKPLVGSIAAEAATHQVLPMELGNGPLPTASVSLLP